MPSETPQVVVFGRGGRYAPPMRKITLVAALAVLTPPGAALGCGSFGSAGSTVADGGGADSGGAGDSSPADGGGADSGEPADGGDLVDAAEPFSDGGVGLLYVEKFEATVGTDCGLVWAASTATAMILNGGGRLNKGDACRVCSTSAAAAFFSLNHVITNAAPAGAAYSVTAYMRLANGPADTELSVAIDDTSGFKNGARTSSSTYTQVSFSIAGMAGKAVTVMLSGRTVSPGAACFDVDDVVIRRVQ